MRRRSTLGSSAIAVVPIRLSEMPGMVPGPPKPPRHSSVVQRQLISTGSSTLKRKPVEEQKKVRPEASNVVRSLKFPLQGKPKEHVNETLTNLNQCATKGVLVGPCEETDSNRTDSINPAKNDETLSRRAPIAKSGRLSSITKIPKFSSSSKQGTPAASLDSTAVFEEVEVATLTSTPHPERKSKIGMRKSVASVDSDVAEQMKLLISEHRSIMQVMKLSFQKMNALVASQTELNEGLTGTLKVLEETQLETTQVLRELKHQLQEMSVSKGKTSNDEGAKFINISNVAGSQNTNLASVSDMKKSEHLLIHSIHSKKMLSPMFEDDKENCEEPSKKSLSAYLDMKSDIHFLKTPVSMKTFKPRRPDTPNTELSNTVHHQLEELLESSATE